MYQSYYPIGTAGHRALSLVSYIPHAAYYGGNIHQQTSLGPPPPPPYANHPVYAAPAPAAAPQAPQEQVTGGINAVLEYEPQNMSAFLCWCAFGMLSQNRSPSKEFEKVMVLILYATRLPKLSIIIALEYLNQRFSNTHIGHMAELEVFLKIVISLVLANKFNDDNTFTNRSWCGATGLKIETLNAEEAAWLKEVNWQLNVVKFQPNIRTLEECWKTWLVKYSAQPVVPASSAYCLPALSPESFHDFSSIPSSPLYESPVSSMYSNNSPMGSSPVKFSQDWVEPMPLAQPPFNARLNPYVPLPPQSIWAYTPTQYLYVPQMNDNYYGYTNPYYHCSLASC